MQLKISLFAALVSVDGLAVQPRVGSRSRLAQPMQMAMKGPGGTKSPRGFGSWGAKLGGIVNRNKGGSNQGGGGGNMDGNNGGNNIIRRKSSEGAADSSSSDDDAGAMGLWQQYEAALEAQPLLVKGLTSMTGFFLGDLMAQLFIEKSGPYDPSRTARLASFGLLVHGTTSHWFYGNLDALIPGTTAAVVATKVFIDQVLWNPIFGCMFFGYMGLTTGEGLGGAVAKIKRDLMTQVTGSWTVWPVAHAINFKFIPTSQRVLYINTIQIFYNCFLSIVGSREGAKA